MPEKAILYDSTKCIACRACQVACKQWWELPGEETVNKGTYENPTILTPKTWNRILFNEVEDKGKIDWIFTRRACMHCTEAVCVWVCPTYARQYSEKGYVSIDQERCIACGRCIEYCPFKLPKLGESDVSPRVTIQFAAPRPVAYKCKFCEDRVEEGISPACVKTCPTGALIFGDRADLVKEGRSRVAVLAKTNPKARLYGDTELGGLHVLTILTVDPEVIGFPREPKVGTSYPAFSENTFPDWYTSAVSDGKLPLFPSEARRDWYLQPNLKPVAVRIEPDLPQPAASTKFNWTGALMGGWLGIGIAGAGAALLWTLRRRIALKAQSREAREE